MILSRDKQGKERIFATVSEAAKALGVDASNIGKVLRGKRPRAGGYTFERTAQRPTTKAGRQYVKKQKETVQRKKLLNTVHDRLKELNVRYRNAKKEQVFETDPVLQKMMSHTNFFGSTKTGGYNISSQNLKQFTDQELQNLLRVLRNEERKYINYAEREGDIQNAAAIANEFGISTNRANALEDLWPVLFDLLHLAKMDEFFRYDDVLTALSHVMKYGASEDQLQEFIDTIYGAYWGNDSAALTQSINKMNKYSIDKNLIDDYSRGS